MKAVHWRAIVWALSGHYEISRSPTDSSIGGGFEKFMWGSEDDQLCGDDNSGYRGLTWHILDKCYKEVEFLLSILFFSSIESLHILCFAQGRYTTTSCKREHWNGRSQKIIWEYRPNLWWCRWGCGFSWMVWLACQRYVRLVTIWFIFYLT